MIRFNCDYLEGAHPRIIEALTKTNMDQTVGYGCDEYCDMARGAIKKVCGDDILVLFVKYYCSSKIGKRIINIICGNVTRVFDEITDLNTVGVFFKITEKVNNVFINKTRTAYKTVIIAGKSNMSRCDYKHV